MFDFPEHENNYLFSKSDDFTFFITSNKGFTRCGTYEELHKSWPYNEYTDKIPQSYDVIHLEEKYPKHEFSLIMGEDNLNSFHKWKNYNVILERHTIYVYPRLTNNSAEIQLINHPKVHRIEAPIVEISSTFIRNGIKAKKNIKPMLPEKVWEYIDKGLFYI